MVMARRLEMWISERTRLLGCWRAVVVTTYQKLFMDGETTTVYPSLCRPWCIDSRGERILLCIIGCNRRAPTAEITNNYDSGDSGSFPLHIVQRTLLHYRSTQLAVLTHCCADCTSLTIAPTTYSWTSEVDHLEEWNKVAYSDELRFLVHHIDGQVRIRRFSREILAPVVQFVGDMPVGAILSCGLCFYETH